MNSKSKYYFSALFIFTVFFSAVAGVSKKTNLQPKTNTQIISCIDSFIAQPGNWKDTMNTFSKCLQTDPSFKTNPFIQNLVKDLESAQKVSNKKDLEKVLEQYRTFIEDIVWENCTIGHSLQIKKNFNSAVKKMPV